jgi:hypothetical protein
VVKIVTTLSDRSKRISTRTYRADCTKSDPRTVRIRS